MTAQQDPYVRVYYRVIDDPKFRDVFDDDARLACWLRLLLIADGTYPAPAPIPQGVKRGAFQHLVTVGLVDLEPGGRYRIHGMDSERGARSKRAADAAAESWRKRRGDASAVQPQSVSNASASAPNMHSAPLHSEPNQSAPNRAESGARDDGIDPAVKALQHLAETLSGTPYGFPLHSAMGQKVAGLVAKHGPAAVEAEWRRIAAEERGMPTVRQLVLGADNALNRVSAPAPATPADRKAETAAFVARINREVADSKRGLHDAG